MNRRLVQLTEEQEGALHALSDSDGKSVSAHVRAAVDRYLWMRAEANRLIDGSAGLQLTANRRMLVYVRDGFQCQDCGKSGIPGNRTGDLNVHHLVSGSHKAEDLITLCKTCHGRADAARRKDEGKREYRPVSGTYSVAQAAAILDVTTSRLRFLLRQGRIEAERLGRDWFITPAALAAFERRPEGWQKGRPRSRPAE